MLSDSSPRNMPWVAGTGRLAQSWQHRRRYQRQQRHAAPDRLARNKRALQSVGKQISQWYDDGGNAAETFRLLMSSQWKLSLVTNSRAATRPPLPFGFTAEAAPEDRQQRHQHRDAQQAQQPEQLAADYKIRSPSSARET